jgi:hypothetical protein
MNAAEVYSACVHAIHDGDISGRFLAALDSVNDLGERYDQRVVENQLHLYPACIWGKGDQIVIGALSKDQFNELYSSYMVPATKPARVFYDQLVNSAPLGKCPLCCFGQVSTLDHFMPKAFYPYFSVLPKNLVPVCTDCNKKKGSHRLAPFTQSLHPYFEVQEVETHRWLFATIVQSSPPTAKFSVAGPEEWGNDLRSRVQNHFNDLDLASRFAIEAASELTSLSEILDQVPADQVSQLIRIMVPQGAHRNTWKVALYEALSQSIWYQTEGYKSVRG